MTLGLPDLIEGGIESPAELAAATRTDPDALARLIRHLVDRGVFTEPLPGRVGLGEVRRLLVTSHPDQRAV